jgi:hypothetical protein
LAWRAASSISARVGGGAAERDVLGHRAVEQEVVLQHHAELRAVLAEADVVEVAPVDEHAPGGGPVERHHERDERALAAPARAHERRGAPGRRVERHALEHRHALAVAEPHVLERHVAAHAAERLAARVLVQLGGLLHHLADAVQPGDGLGDLRADARHAHHRRGEQPDEEHVHEQVAERHPARQHGPPAHRR